MQMAGCLSRSAGIFTVFWVNLRAIFSGLLCAQPLSLQMRAKLPGIPIALHLQETERRTQLIEAMMEGQG
jgi:hypothetical protein